MPQTLQIFVSLTINPPAPAPLVGSPASSLASPIVLPAVTSGVAVSLPIDQVSGGTGPYLAPVIDPNSPTQLPAGMSAAIDANGNVTLSGTPPAVTAPVTGVFILDVTDSGA